jgi:hypothetical protein
VAGTEDHRRSSFAGRARSAVSHSGQDDHVKQTAAVAKTVAGRAGDVPKAVSRKVAWEDAGGAARRRGAADRDRAPITR